MGSFRTARSSRSVDGYHISLTESECRLHNSRSFPSTPSPLTCYNVPEIFQCLTTGSIDGISAPLPRPNHPHSPLDCQKEPDLISILSYILSRLPRLKHLVLTPKCQGSLIQRCFQALPDGEILFCRPNEDTDLVLAACSRLTKLANLTIWGDWGVSLRNFQFQGGTFSSLRKLSMRTLLEDWIRLLESGNLPPSLMMLVAEGGSLAPSSIDLARLFRGVASAASQLIIFNFKHQSTTTPAIKFQDIHPLLTCKHLRTVSIRHTLGVDVSQNEIEQMLDAWPNLSTLILSYTQTPNGPRGLSTHLDWSPPTLPITVLDVFAAKRPRMWMISLCMHAELPDLLDDGSNQVGPPPPVLERLHTLNITFSTITKPDAVALYLAERLSQGTKVIWDSYRAQNDAPLKQAEAQWGEVVLFLNTLRKQRAALERRFKAEISRIEENLELELENRIIRMQLEGARGLQGDSDSDQES